jgi:peptidoglycan/xylan/chitin deacetylase (PgdA/CDA1 family)
VLRLTGWLLRLAARAVSRLSGADLVVSYPVRSGRVALTFDDGPHPATTTGLLTVLAAHDAHATFFVIGERARGRDGMLAKITAAGHELGNHLMRDQPSVLLAADEFDRQLSAVHQLLHPHGPVRFFRPGSGWFTPRMLRCGARLEYACALGTLGLVASQYPDPAAVARRIARRSRPGSIIVLHEGTRERADVVGVTDRLLTDLARAGLRAVTLSELARRGSSDHPGT